MLSQPGHWLLCGLRQVPPLSSLVSLSSAQGRLRFHSVEDSRALSKRPARPHVREEVRGQMGKQRAGWKQSLWALPLGCSGG